MKHHSEAPSPPVTGDVLANRRLALCVALAAAVHAAVIFGVRFTVTPPPQRESVLSLNVSLVEHRGGAPGAAAAPPGTPAGAADPDPSPPTEPAAEPRPPAPEPVAVVEPGPEPPQPVVEPTPTPRREPVPEVRPEQPVPRPRSEPQPEVARPTPSPPAGRAPSAVDLMSSGLQIARRATEPETGSAREKHLDPRAMTTLERFYMEAWVRKVEQVGTLNFPEEARRRNLTGSLVLEVAVRSDGTVRNIRLLRSSGHRVLDGGAQRIVELAAPFAPFPDALRERYDVLYIKRKWVFEHGSRLTGG